MSSSACVNLGADVDMALKTMSMFLVDLYSEFANLIVANSLNVF